MIRNALALVHAWLVLDFFGAQRTRNEEGSSLTTTIFTQSFLALVVAAILFDSESSIVPYAAANLSLSTVLVGMAALSAPHRRERRQADRLLVATAPVRRGTLELARTLHAAFYVVLITTGMAIPPAILSFWVAGKMLWVIPAYLVLASVLAGLVAGALALLLRVVERIAGAIRAALVAGTLKALLLGGAFIGFALCMPRLDGTADDLPLGRAGASSWPPYWAARWLADPIGDALFGLALIGSGAFLFVLAVLVGDRERSTSPRREPRLGISGRLERAFTRRGPLLGATTFVSAMLFRSPAFRARVLPLFGMPLAMVLLAYWEEGPRERLMLVGMTLQFPAIYLPFLVLFLPFAEQEGSGWLFDSSPGFSVALARIATFVALSVRILLPVHVAAAGLLLIGGFDPWTVAALAVFSWSVAVLFAGVATGQLTCMPFTAAADQAPGMDLGGLVWSALALALVGGAYSQIAGSWIGGVVALAIVTITLTRLTRSAHRAAAVANSTDPTA